MYHVVQGSWSAQFRWGVQEAKLLGKARGLGAASSPKGWADNGGDSQWVFGDDIISGDCQGRVDMVVAVKQRELEIMLWTMESSSCCFLCASRE